MPRSCFLLIVLSFAPLIRCVDAEFNSFVQDYLGPAGKESKGGDVSMANFLDNFFDDIPEEDFGVVPDMGFVQ